jgi:hypothetical protein
MKKLILFCGVLFAIIFSANTARASHVMAGEITYKQINGDSLLVTVKIYRDCNGIALSFTPLTILSEKHTAAMFSLKLTSVKDVTGVSPRCGMLSRCSGSYTYGIEEYIFQDTVILPNDSSCKYTLSWEQCCRNGAITTGASGQNFYIETTLDKCLAPINSSPEFVRMPVILIGVGQDISVNHTAVDPDNDFVTYELINPLSGAGSPIAYSGSWTSNKPLTFLGFPYATLSYPAGFRFDSLSGNMLFRPSKPNEVTVVTVKAKEWRKIGGTYVLIGEMIRDVQLIVVPLPNNKPPKIGNPDSTFINVCSPGTICADIPVTDADANDSLDISYANNLPNATVNITTTSPNKKSVKVCFTADSAMIASGGSYFFSLYVHDNSCPLPGKAEKTYFIKISPLTGGLAPLTAVYVCETDSPVVLLNPGTGTNIWSGTGISHDSTGYKFSPVVAQKGWHWLNYNYTDSFSSCSYADSLHVRVVEQPKANFTVNDSVGLATDTFMFTNTTTADTLFGSLWSMGDTLGMGIVTPNPKYRYNDTGMFTVTLWVSNGICPPDSITKTNYIKIGSFYLGKNSVLENNLKIYPNPAEKGDNIIVEGDNLTNVVLYDATGRLVNTPINQLDINKTQINTITLAAGVYWLSVFIENNAAGTLKLIIKP